MMIRWTCQNIRQSLQKKSNTIKAPEPVSTFVKTNRFWSPESLLALGSSHLLIANSSACHFMHASGHQMLDQVVKDDRDHDSWV